MLSCMMRVFPEKHAWGSFQKSIPDEGHSREAYMMRVFPEKHAWWESFQKRCFSGMTFIMHAFLEWPSSCMLFWNDPHHACFSGKTLIMYAFLEWLSIHDEGHSRKAYMMRVIPEKHTWWGSFQKSMHDEVHSFLEWLSSCMLFWNDLHHVCFSGMTFIMYAFLERVIPEKHTWWGSFQKSMHDEGHSKKA
jgi:hypothetical protein